MNAAENSLGPFCIAELAGFSAGQLNLLVQLAEQELAAGEIALALETLSVLNDLDPFHAKGCQLLAEAHRRAGDHARAEALEEFAKGLEE